MITLKNLVLFSILSFLMIEPAISQDVDLEKYLKRRKGVTYPNIIKINTLAIAFNNISLLYERSIVPRLSAGIGAGYKYGGPIPKVLTVDNSTINLNTDEIRGYSITPEMRYYLRTCDPNKQEGFYAGLYFKYTYYETAVNFDYYRLDNPVEFIHADMAMREYGVGIQLGYQLMLWERFSIDFLFVAPRVSNYTLAYRFDQMPSQEFFDDLSEYINEVVDRFGGDYKVEIKQEGEGKARTSFPFVGARMGLSLGFAF